MDEQLVLKQLENELYTNFVKQVLWSGNSVSVPRNGEIRYCPKIGCRRMQINIESDKHKEQEVE